MKRPQKKSALKFRDVVYRKSNRVVFEMDTNNQNIIIDNNKKEDERVGNAENIENNSAEPNNVEEIATSVKCAEKSFFN